MYSKAELSAKAHIELIDIAKEMGIAKATRLDAHELVYKILDHQAHCVGQCRKSHGNQTLLGNQQGEDEEYNHTSRADRPTDLNQKLR